MGQFWVKTIALSGSVLGDRQQAAVRLEDLFERQDDLHRFSKEYEPRTY